MSALHLAAISLVLSLSFKCNSAHEGRIVNGTDAQPGEFPFMISLRRASSGRHACGASLLNANWVLTAAHCVMRAKPEHMNLQYGSVELNPNTTNLANVSEIFMHEAYNPSDLYVNDIALLKLQAPIKDFGHKVRAVHLPELQQFTEGNTSVTLIGWGLNATGGKVQPKLQRVQLQTFTDEECSSRHQAQLHATTICAGVPEGGKGQCSGDSGGPLVVNGTQIGIVSWSRKPCTIAPFPGVFTEVSAYVDWIEATIKRESNESLRVQSAFESIGTHADNSFIVVRKTNGKLGLHRIKTQVKKNKKTNITCN